MVKATSHALILQANNTKKITLRSTGQNIQQAKVNQSLQELVNLSDQKYHRCLAGIIQLEDMQGLIPDGPLTPFAQAMPDQYKDADAVKAYRAYYIGEKKAFAKWKAGNTPKWWK